ncbi:hypothetical protein [Butyrivibrio sp. AE3004]|uniref:hypothetical protein n=1 Tax=Butyrivibrio sp. AE3004 TaxID=1506994 RepID=UPI000493F9FC|nr:hypothetical protein [Butyrivibrio sp. AE3004]
MKNRFHLYIMIFLFSIFLSACGLSDENHSKLKNALNDLTTQKDYAEDLYSKLTTEDFKEELSELSEKYNEIKDQDISKLKNNQTDDMILQMETLRDAYKQTFDRMNDELKTEEKAAKEEVKHIEVLCRIENKSGSELSSIILKDVSKSTESKNFLGENKILSTGQILEGAVLPIYSDSTSRSISVTDTLGNVTEYPLDIEDINSAVGSGISIVINAPGGALEISSYSTTER